MLKLLIDGQTFHTADVARGIGYTMVNLIKAISKIKDIECHLVLSDISLAIRHGISNDSIILHSSEVLREVVNHKWFLRPAQNRKEHLLQRIFGHFRENRKRLWQKQYTLELSILTQKLGIHTYWTPNSLMPNVILPYKIVSTNILMACTIHDLIPLKLKECLAFWIKKSNYIRRLKECSQNYDLFFHVSESTKLDYMQSLGTSEKVHVATLGGVAQSFFSSSKQINNTDNRYILTVSGDDPRKNLKMAIHGFSEFANNNPMIPFKLYVVGGVGPNKIDSILQTIHDCNLVGRVIFLGYVEENILKQVYKEASIFLFPSRYEGLGLPLLEALAAGIPIACSRNSSMLEVCASFAHYFDSENQYEIAAALEAAWNEIGNTEMTKARIAHAKIHTWERVGQIYIDTIKEHATILT